MSGLEPIAVVACVATVVSALHAVAEMAKRRRANSELDFDADERASCCCGVCGCLPCNTAWRRYRQNRILRRRILLIAYEIEIAYLVCPRIVRRAIRQSVNFEYGEDDQFRDRMELVLVDILALQSEVTEVEDEVQVSMDALLRNCNAIRNRAVWSIASYGFRVAQGYELSYGFDATSFRSDLEGQLRRRQGSRVRRGVRSLVLASHRVRVRVLSRPVAKIREEARGGEGTNEKPRNTITRIFKLAGREPRLEGGSGLLCGLRFPKIKWPNLRIPKLSIPRLQFQTSKLRISKLKKTPWVPRTRRTIRRESSSPEPYPTMPAPSPTIPEPSFYQPSPRPRRSPRPRPVSPVRSEPAPAGPSQPRCLMTDDEERAVNISAGGAALAGAMMGGPLGFAVGLAVGFFGTTAAVSHNHRNCNHGDGEPCYGRR